MRNRNRNHSLLYFYANNTKNMITLDLRRQLHILLGSINEQFEDKEDDDDLCLSSVFVDGGVVFAFSVKSSHVFEMLTYVALYVDWWEI